MPYNYHLMDLVKERIRSEAKWGGFYMERWRNDRVYRDGPAGTSCGTIACIAGWASVIAEERGVDKVKNEIDVVRIAERELGITHLQARELFLPGAWGPTYSKYSDAMLKGHHSAAAEIAIAYIDQWEREQGLAEERTAGLEPVEQRDEVANLIPVERIAQMIGRE